MRLCIAKEFVDRAERVNGFCNAILLGREPNMTGLLWLAVVVIIAVVLANFVNAAVGGIVGLILAVLVFLLVIREADTGV